MVMVVVIHQVVEVVMVVVTDLWGRMSALSVAVLGIGLVIAHQLAVAEVAASSPPAPGLVVGLAVEIAMQIVNVMWKIDMMQGVLVIETAMTAEIASMEAAAAMQTTGTHPVEEIGLEGIGMEPQNVINHQQQQHHHQAYMSGRETMIGISAQGGAVTDMEAAVVEDPHVMKEETTGTELVRMTVLEGEEAALLLSTTEK